MKDLSGAVTPTALVAKFAEAGITISERTLRERARQLGAYRIIGKTMFLMPEDIELILEAAKPQPKLRVAAEPSSSWTDSDTEALIQRLTRRPQRGKHQEKK